MMDLPGSAGEQPGAGGEIHLLTSAGLVTRIASKLTSACFIWKIRRSLRGAYFP